MCTFNRDKYSLHIINKKKISLTYIFKRDKYFLYIINERKICHLKHLKGIKR